MIEQQHDLVQFIDGRMCLRLHPGQQRAWDSVKRFVTVLAGCQGGKTSFGPPWLFREIALKGPGDYMIVTPTFPLLELKALPTFRKLFEKKLELGQYQGHPVRKFTFSKAGAKKVFGCEPEEDTIIYFGHAGDPESLESATAKGAWLDEAGQKKFRLGSYEAILRRLSIHQGRILTTTTPYDLGFIKQKLFDPWQADPNHPEIDIIRFDSTENPSFPQAEFERARRDLPLWKFNMFYRAMFERPVGLIYDCFEPSRHRLKPIEIPDTWHRYLGLDFGGVNICGVFFAEEPMSKRLFAYREYYPREKLTVRQHVDALLKGEPKMPMAFGGAGSEDHWRAEFQAAGLPVMPPDVMESTASGGSRTSSPVEVGIDRVYATIRNNGLFIFSTLSRLLDEIGSYSRETDEAGNVKDTIDSKENYHALDATRYLIGHIRRPYGGKFEIGRPPPGRGNCVEMMPEGTFADPHVRSRWWDQQW